MSKEKKTLVSRRETEDPFRGRKGGHHGRHPQTRHLQQHFLSVEGEVRYGRQGGLSQQALQSCTGGKAPAEGEPAAQGDAGREGAGPAHQGRAAKKKHCQKADRIITAKEFLRRGYPLYKVLPLCGLSKSSYYYSPSRGKRDRKASTGTQSKGDILYSNKYVLERMK